MVVYFRDKNIFEPLEDSCCDSGDVLNPVDHWESILVHMVEASNILGFTKQKKWQFIGPSSICTSKNGNSIFNFLKVNVSCIWSVIKTSCYNLNYL